VSKGGESSSYTYDGSLLLTDTRAGTMNALIDYTYNSDLQIDSIGYADASESFLYDNDGLLTDAGAYSITRDAANGLPESVTDSTVTQGRDFSSYGEVDGIDYTVGATAPYSWSVVRDNAGRITQKVENIGVDSVTWDYTYDLMGRLETVYKDNALAEAYIYDDQGNRLEEINVLRGVARTYTYDDEDKIVYAGLDIYTYNLDGFLSSRSISSGAFSGAATFDYSSRGELLSAILPDSTVISYDHDPMGRRVAKRINGTITEKYLWQSATTLLAVYDGSDNLLQRFEYSDGRMPVAMTAGGAVYYLTYDQVGSLRAVFDSVGTEIKRVNYDSFGNILSDSNPSFTVPFGFAGGLHDRDTGLVRFGARDYDPAVGRWTAKDPIDFGGGDLNLLSYTDQDPVNWVDNTGRGPLPEYESNYYNYRPWFQSADMAAQMTAEWATGTGPDFRMFGPGTPEVGNMMNAPGVERARDYFHNKNKGNCPSDLEGVSNFAAGFGLKGFVQAGLDPTEQFVGSYRVDILPNSNGTKTIVLTNNTSMTSATYGLLPSASRNPLFQEFGTTTQHYIWTEPVAR